jgi:hypothetical protein
MLIVWLYNEIVMVGGGGIEILSLRRLVQLADCVDVSIVWFDWWNIDGGRIVWAGELFVV